MDRVKDKDVARELPSVAHKDKVSQERIACIVPRAKMLCFQHTSRHQFTKNPVATITEMVSSIAL